jgi:hypothetical protein
VSDAGGGERPRGEGAVAGLGVARHGVREEAEYRAHGAVGERAVPAHALAAAEEARPEHVVGAAARHGLEDRLEVGRVVFPVTVDVDGGGIALVAGGLEARPESRAKSERHGVRPDAHLVLSGDPRGRVPRAIVDEQHVDRKPTGLPRNPGKHRPNGILLVPGDDDGEAARSGTRPRCKRPA